MKYWREELLRYIATLRRALVGPSQTLDRRGLHVDSQPTDAPSPRIVQSFLDRLQHAALFLPVLPPPLLEQRKVCQTQSSTSRRRASIHRSATTLLTAVRWYRLNVWRNTL